MLVRRAIEPGYGKWVFPGGYVDRGEPLTAAAIREAREECGLDVRLDGLVNIYSYPGRAPVIVVYAATAIGGTLCIDDECLESAEFDDATIPWDRARVPQHARGPARLPGRLATSDSPCGVVAGRSMPTASCRIRQPAETSAVSAIFLGSASNQSPALATVRRYT